MKSAKGPALDRLAALYGVERMLKCERRWYTLWLWLHNESDARVRGRCLEVIRDIDAKVARRRGAPLWLLQLTRRDR